MTRSAAAALAVLAVTACAPSTGPPRAGDASPQTEAPSLSAPPTSGSAAAAPDPTPRPRPAPLPTAAARLEASRDTAFDAARALAFATGLATNPGPRPAGSPADAAARGAVAAAFRAAGWSVAEEPFALPQGGESANVVAWVGADRPTRHVVVGAHLDTVEASPGANDNASGIGVLVALAEQLAGDKLPVPAVLVAFGAEERQPVAGRANHVGSEAYAAAHGADVAAMVSVDMVGHGDTTLVCWLRTASDDLARRLFSLASGPGYRLEALGDISDHGPFARRGIPAAWLWTGREPRWHTPADTAEHLREADLARAGELLLAFLRRGPGE